MLVEDIHSISFVLYNAFLIPVTFFSFVYYIAALRTIMAREGEKEEAPDAVMEYPFVTIQIPTYNEPVAIRCAKSCLEFDYPAERFEVLIGDDSKDQEVMTAIDAFASESKGHVKVVRRDNNRGFKSGNLNNMLKHSRGEILAIFDSDFTAPKDFLKKMVAPFMQDEKVACTQSEWDFLNVDTNYISKLSATLLMFYYAMIVPVNRALGVPLMFGSGEAVRKDVVVALGGWNERSLTEDTEFSIRALKNGYKIVYLDDVKVKGEVPYTLKGLMSQQRRWAYGNTKVFMEHAKSIIFGPFTLLQKIMITYTTSIGYLSNFLLLLFFVSGTIYFFSQPPAPIDLMKFINQTSQLVFITSGFLAGGAIALYKKDKVSILLPALITVVSMGLLISYSVCIGFLKAVFGKELLWSAINKEGNHSYVSPQPIRGE
jgi:cellulose synthase/poly-beta-1,6-N-acetylglucosamine synthase-like glycosyltransferase